MINNVELAYSNNLVTISPLMRKASVETFRVESNYFFITSTHVIDQPKERNSDA